MSALTEITEQTAGEVLAANGASTSVHPHAEPIVAESSGRTQTPLGADGQKKKKKGWFSRSPQASGADDVEAYGLASNATHPAAGSRPV